MSRRLPFSVFLALLIGIAIGAWAVVSGFVIGWIDGLLP